MRPGGVAVLGSGAAALARTGERARLAPVREQRVQLDVVAAEGCRVHDRHHEIDLRDQDAEGYPRQSRVVGEQLVPEELAEEMLEKAGFTELSKHKLEHDFINVYYVMRKR